MVLGRIVALRMRGGDSVALDVHNIHLVPNERTPPRAQLELLRGSIAPLREAVSVLVGDLNVSAPGEGRLDLEIGRLTVDSSPLVDALGEALADFREIIAQGYSRAQARDWRPRLSSRLDRMFTNSPTASLVGGRALARYCVGVLDRSGISDEDVARALRSLCHAQVIADLDADIAETAPDEEARAIRGRAARSLSVFSERHRRIESIAVRDPATGTVHSDPDQVGVILARHWAPVFASIPSPSRDAI